MLGAREKGERLYHQRCVQAVCSCDAFTEGSQDFLTEAQGDAVALLSINIRIIFWPDLMAGWHAQEQTNEVLDYARGFQINSWLGSIEPNSIRQKLVRIWHTTS